MNLRLKLVITSLLAFSIQISAFATDRPNIVVILADDLGYSDLGCYGGEIHTPHIDALAKAGARFSQMYNSARCCPTRASLMTGLYPTQAGIGDFTTNKPTENKGPGYLGRLRDDCATIAEMLKPASYRSYYVGKWHMHPATGPIERGFDEFYGYTNDHSHDQFDRDYYKRLPADHPAEFIFDKDKYYATDAFNDYALEFIRQGQSSGSPWLVFLGHSSPHFPVQAPADRVDKFEKMYLKGWDKLREERFARMQQIGLADGPAWQLSPRSIVPVDEAEIANGYSGEENPAWDSLPEERRRDLARRMAVFAAMVEGVDQGVGRIVQHLKDTKDLDNTLILFTSDNGACYEWGPFGFDGVSRKGETTLYTGERLREVGGPGTHHSYGSAWANLGNTPLRMYKHFTHEGGINSPFIAHWPIGFAAQTDWIHEPVHVMDIVPTILAAANAEPITQLNEVAIQPIEGTNLLPVMRGEKLAERGIGFDHQGAHAWRKGDWKIVWSKRMPTEISWELYNISEDRCEMTDLASNHPERVKEMVTEWTEWAKRVGVIWEPRETASKKSGKVNDTQTTPSNVMKKQPTLETPAQAAKADQFSLDAFIEKPTDRKPGPVMSPETIRAGLKSHDRALYIKSGWIRDPYITLGPDEYYYLTGTQPNEGDPREVSNPYNIGLGKQSIVGNQVRLYRSKDLIEWESLGAVFTQADFFDAKPDRKNEANIWAPEVHWMANLGENGRWALVHCPKHVSSLALSAGKEPIGPWSHPMKGTMGARHDPSLFQDDDGTVWLLSGNTNVEPLSKDLSHYTSKAVRIDPSGSRPGPDGELINRIGHEGATMIKVGGKYVHLGTAWSTDQGRKGSYNLYYSVANKITGPYGPRKFVGRFLGHGTPFKDKEGKWWCTAFFNANVPPFPREGIEKLDIGDDAKTINEQGVTIVPLDVRVLGNGEVIIRAKDPAYATPGPDESQKF